MRGGAAREYPVRIALHFNENQMLFFAKELQLLFSEKPPNAETKELLALTGLGYAKNNDITQQQIDGK